MPTPITSIGPETRVNVTTASDQKAPSITGLADGGWIVTWQSNNQDGGGYGIYQQRYDKTGTALWASDVRVNLTVSSDQADPSVTALADGGWLVTWASQNQDVGWNGGIYQQRYDKNGNPLFSTDKLVNGSVTFDQSLPCVTTLSDGGWVVTWVSEGQDGSGKGVYQQRYNASGTAIGTETKVNALTDGTQSMPAVTALSGGGWVVTWESHSTGPTGHSIYQQRYDASGTASSVTDLPVEVTAGDYKVKPSVTGLSDGGWVVTWTTYTGGDIVQQRFDKDGIALFSTPQRVNSTLTDLQEPAVVTALRDGGWVVVWQSANQDGSGNGLYLQAFDRNGNPAGSADMLVNSTTSGNQEMPSVTALNDGWIVTWQSSGQDGDGYGIYQRRYFTNSPPTDITLSRTSVNEDAAGVIATLDGIDPNAGDTFTFTLAEDASGKFEIIGNELRLKTGESLDYETATSHTIKITVTDQTGLSLTKTATIAVKDVVENRAPSGVTLSRTAVDEDETGLIATLDGVDADSGDTFTFTLAEDLSGKFEIVGSELRLKAGENLDYETAKSHNLKITVTDRLGASATKTVLITVNDIADTNDAPTDIRLNGGLGTAVAEDATADTFIGVLSATDRNGDAVTFGFAPGGDAGGLFVIDSITNQIKLASGAALDYEALASGAKSYTLSIIATDSKGASSTPQTITIGITDVNERPDTVIAGTGPGGSIVVDEGATTGTLVASLTGIDPEGDIITYALLDNAGGRFKIVGTDIRVADGRLLDFEDSSGGTHVLTLLAIDTRGMARVKTITVNVLGKNDAPTDIVLSGTSIDENAAANTEVATLSVIDQDFGDTFTYALVDDAGGRFKLDATGTKILVADGSRLDFETASSHAIRVRVTDAGGLSIEKTVIIGLNEVAEAPANRAPTDITLSGGAKGNASVDENAGAGIVVGELAASDPDTGDSFTYTLLDDAGGRFRLDASGTRLLVSDGSLIDYEATTSYVVKVQVSDGKGGTFVKALAVAVNNLNEAPTDLVFIGGTVDENATTNVFVGSLAAVDEETSGTYLYELIDNAGGRFKIGPDGRSILVANGSLLDYETAPFHDIRVRVRDGGHSFEKVIRINLSDVTEAPPNAAPTDIALSVTSVSENAANGMIIGTFSATDPNAGDVLSYALIDDAGGRFEIFDGKLRVKDGARLDFEAAASHSIKVRVTDGGGLSLEKEFAVTLSDVDETTPTPSNRAPTDITLTGGLKGNASADENAAADAEVGSLGALDSDIGDLFTYTLLDDAGGRFKLDASGTRILVADGSLIDYEVGSSYIVKVQVSDGRGGTFTKAIAIAVNNLNEAPLDILFTGSSVDENAAGNVFVGSLGVLDADTSGAYTYTLVDNAGGRFKLGADGKSILVANGAVLDYEAATFHDITVRVTDGGHTIEKTIRIHLNDVAEAPPNTAPYDIVLSGTTIAENAANGAEIGLFGALDGTPGGAFTYTLVNDAGGRFEIFNGKLRVKDGSRLDYETATSHTIKVRVTDSGGLSFEKEIDISLADVNETPVNHTPGVVIASGKAITNMTDNGPAVAPFKGVMLSDAENDTLTVKVSFSAADGDLIIPDYLVPDDGMPDVADGVRTYTFTGKADTLALILRMVRFEPVSRPDAEAGSVVTTVFSIKVSDAAHPGDIITNDEVTVHTSIANRSPTDISLDANAVREASADGTQIGTFSATDQANSAFTYELVDNAGGRFRIEGNKLVVNNGLLLDFEQGSMHIIRVRVSDGTQTFEKAMAVSVTDWIGEQVTGSAGNDRLLATLGNNMLSGDSGNDTLMGGMGNDAVFGGIGNDLIHGGAGTDVLYGQAGMDSFVFDTVLNARSNVDTIKDFSVRDDTIRLENAVFRKLAKTGTLNKDFFTIGSKAKDANDYIVYDNKTGALYYDADGSGRAAAVKFAQLTKNLKMTNLDFFVV